MSWHREQWKKEKVEYVRSWLAAAPEDRKKLSFPKTYGDWLKMRAIREGLCSGR